MIKKITITSINNPLIKKLKKAIKKKSFFVIEGNKIINDLFNYNYSLDYLLINKKKLNKFNSIKSQKLVKNVIATNEKILKKFSNLIPNADIIALNKRRKNTLNFDVLKRNNIIIYLHNIQDPGNIGSIIRTCYALNINEILLSQGCAKPYNSKVIRASAGTSLLTNIYEIENIYDLIEKLKENSYLIYYASQKADLLYYKADYKKNFLLILGNEGTGLPSEIISLCNFGLYIPMNNNLESLNVAVCAAIILFEAYKQQI